MTAGRSCPLDYRYQPRDIAQALLRPALQGLDALWWWAALLATWRPWRHCRSPLTPTPRRARHWSSTATSIGLDAEPAWFAAIQAGVERHHATRGNVETELARDALADNGCGCGYPDWVGDETVDYSNRIIQRLHAVVPDPCACSSRRCRNSCAPRWAACPSASCMATRILLAGWSFSQEALSQPETRDAARAACAEAGVQHWASSHSCLPVMQALGDGHWLLNNGAAGMPNVAGELTGCARASPPRRSARPTQAPARRWPASTPRPAPEPVPHPLRHRALGTALWGSWPTNSEAEQLLRPPHRCRANLSARSRCCAAEGGAEQAHRSERLRRRHRLAPCR